MVADKRSDSFARLFGESRGNPDAEPALELERPRDAAPAGAADLYDDPETERQLCEHLSRALDALGVDEERGDWWEISYDNGDAWGCKGVINGRSVGFDVTTTGFSVVQPS